jgi:hypothetical protein
LWLFLEEIILVQDSDNLLRRGVKGDRGRIDKYCIKKQSTAVLQGLSFLDRSNDDVLGFFAVRTSGGLRHGLL